MPVHVALVLCLVETLALAGVLLAWAERVAGARLLVAFLLGVAAWIVGNELPTWCGPLAERPAMALLATASLTSAAFVHFAVVFSGVRAPRPRLAALYGLALTATLLSVAFAPGRFVPFAGLTSVAVPNGVGWVTSSVWAALGALGQGFLLRAFLEARGMERRRIGAVIASSAWGLLCMSGYAIAALDLPLYPWPLLGLPLYPPILVYGILRYRVLVANAWARRALGWALLVALAAAASGAAGALSPALGPLGATWGPGIVAAAAVLVLGGPVRRLAERIVYPGQAVSADDLRRWRAVLSQAGDMDALRSAADALLSQRLAMPVAVRVEGAAASSAEAGAPVLGCARDGGAWACSMEGWDAAPPGPRRLAGLFADVLAEQAARLEGLAATREDERRRQHQARLAELGALAATVAHDVRNPLNVIGMAVAMAPADVRADVGEQVRRIARLADDLLDYARPWQAGGRPVDLAERVAAARGARPGLEVGPGLGAPVLVLADPDRIDRALANLLDNAAAAGGRVGVDAEREGALARLHVYDDGPGIPDGIRDRLFQPFVSRRPGGTGLGLAIVARIVEAHGGSVGLTERPGWATCFTLTLPAAP